MTGRALGQSAAAYRVGLHSKAVKQSSIICLAAYIGT